MLSSKNSKSLSESELRSLMAVVFHFEFEYSLRKLRGTEYVVVNARCCLIWMYGRLSLRALLKTQMMRMRSL
jgi:hypothetical protein